MVDIGMWGLLVLDVNFMWNFFCVCKDLVVSIYEALCECVCVWGGILLFFLGVFFFLIVVGIWIQLSNFQYFDIYGVLDSRIER